MLLIRKSSVWIDAVIFILGGFFGLHLGLSMHKDLSLQKWCGNHNGIYIGKDPANKSGVVDCKLPEKIIIRPEDIHKINKKKSIHKHKENNKGLVK